MATSTQTFDKTIEVFTKIAQREVERELSESTRAIRVKYLVTEKQFNWLAQIYIAEAGSWDPRYDVGVLDEQGNQYSFSYHNFIWNVPHYIPNQKSYGKKYFILKYIKL